MTKATSTVALPSADAQGGDDVASAPIPRSTNHAAQQSGGTARAVLVERVLMALAVLLLVGGVSIVVYPFALQFVTGVRQGKQAESSAQQVAGWPYPMAEEALRSARQYNAELARRGQPILGEAIDPFTGGKTKGQSAAETDNRYQSLLDQGANVMGAIVIPRISVNLPIYHGTSESALSDGAGHLYGTSLPVGGPSTHAVLTGHRGMVKALMFTRLDEMRRGDSFYVKTMGRTFGYRVDRISVIEPQDSSQLKIEPGVDRVTLMTCTPYGVNSHRLLVSGVRAEIPGEIPEPSRAGPDVWLLVVVLVAMVALACGVLAFFRRRAGILPVRHAEKGPDRRVGGRPRARRNKNMFHRHGVYGSRQ